MPYKFRTPGPWGSGALEDLDPVDIDNNFWQAIQDIKAKASQGVGIDNIVVSGSQFTVVLTDHTLLGPYQLPVMKVIFKGEWLPNYAYLGGSIVTHGGTTYFLPVNFVSDATFDPGANDGHGQNFYEVLLQYPMLTLPSGGAVGMFLRKTGTADYVMGWLTAALNDLSDVLLPISPGPVTGDVLTFEGGFWIAKTLVFPATALASLSDVSLSGPVADQALLYDGSLWRNQTLPPPGSTTLADLTDVDITVSTPPGQGLFWNPSTGKWTSQNFFDPTTWSISASSGNVTIDLSQSAFTRIAFSGNTNILGFTWPAGADGQFVHRMLQIQNGGPYTVTWPSTVKWPSGTPPVVSNGPSGGLDLFVLHTIDGGSTVYGSVVGQNYS